MFMLKRMSMLAIAFSCFCSAGASADGPGLGMPVSERDAAAVDFVVMPDGRGLPEGSGDAQQGLVVYQRECRKPPTRPTLLLGSFRELCRHRLARVLPPCLTRGPHMESTHDRQGGPNDRLSGGLGSLASGQPVKTIGSYWPYATTVFDYIRRAMPYQQPGSLSADEVYALTAYLLAENAVIDHDQMLDAETLPTIQMPNRQGFGWAWPVD